MFLALQVLDGPLKGQEISLRKNFVFSGHSFSDEEMGENHCLVDFDQNFSWNIRCLEDFKVRVSSNESSAVSLIPGLVFHVGQTGFKVIEKAPLYFEDWEDAIKGWLIEQNWDTKTTDFFFFLYPIRLTFVSGPQADEFLTISYGPRMMGFNNLDLNLKDPFLPEELVKFYQIGEQAYVENLSADKVFINKQSFHQHPIADGDKLSFGSSVVELTILR